ncbi:hypothetical protein J5500_01800 [Candidatus Saccharibacteria bacterium]|nr:hypothetical protein [Candidatus Saccharibacteria bacterium]
MNDSLLTIGEEDAEHFDVFMDKNQRNEKFGKAGIGVFLLLVGMALQKTIIQTFRLTRHARTQPMRTGN